MKKCILETDLWLRKPIDEVFSFFANAHNLDQITPPWLHFRILTPQPITLKPGAIIDYRLKLHGIPILWRTEISNWDPPHQFVDRQIRGPYRLWVHEHTFSEENGGTRVQDRVEYASSGWIFESFVHSWLVKPDLTKIFNYRQERIQEIFS